MVDLDSGSAYPQNHGKKIAVIENEVGDPLTIDLAPTRRRMMLRCVPPREQFGEIGIDDAWSSKVRQRRRN